VFQQVLAVAKKKPTAPIKIPFYKNTGGLVPEAEGPRDWIEWRDNFEFDALLVMTGFDRGGIGAIRAVFADEAGVQYPMFVSDLAELLRDAGVVCGKVRARWTFAKRGKALYGIRRVPGPSAVHPEVAILAVSMLSGDLAAAAAFVDRAAEAIQGR
jgi:hypothetical protein